MDVEGGVADLEGVSSFHLNDLHLVSLDADVEGVLQSDVAYSKVVGLSLCDGEDGGVRASAIDEDSMGEGQFLAPVQN